MIRVLFLLAVMAAVAFGAVWMKDHPGTIEINWLGKTVSTEPGPALIILAAVSLLLAMLWNLVRLALRLPGLMTLASRTRRRAKGYDVVTRGMVAVGAGDPAGARRYSAEARRLIGEDPLTLLLEAQAAQLSGERGRAEDAFRRMTGNSATRLLGLRGLFIEARRKGDSAAARQAAEEAVRLAPAAPWANEAVLADRCNSGDWAGARAALERAERLRVLDKATNARQRAVLLTAEAIGIAGTEPDRARDLALEALKLRPDLEPAAGLAGRLLADRGDYKKAARVLEAAWKALPHPDLADLYINLRPGDSVRDRLQRAEALARIAWSSPESKLALVRAAIAARQFGRARELLDGLVAERPTRRVCLAMAELEDAEFGARGRARGWLARAANAPRDPAWVADGLVSDEWAPLSPVSGRLDAFVWMVPPERLTHAPSYEADDVLADVHEPPAVAPPPVLAPPPAEPPAPVAEARPVPAAADPVFEPPAPKPAERAETPPALRPAEPEKAPPPPAPPPAAAEPPPSKIAALTPRSTPVIFPVPHAPDDPGTEAEPKPAEEPPPTQQRRFRLM